MASERDIVERLERLEGRLARLESLLLEGAGPETSGSQAPEGGNGGSVRSPAGVAPAGAWLPEGPGVRHADIWVQGDPRTLGPGSPREGWWRERLSGAVEGRTCRPDEGLRLRFVMERLPGFEGDFDLLRMAAPALEVLRTSGCRFLHLEIARGPEPGLHVAFDNRLPALLTQTWLRNPADEVSGLPEMPPGAPLHVNVMLHGQALEPGGLDGGPVRDLLGRVARSLEAGLERVHQLTVSTSEDPQQGLSVGVEAIHDEQGTVGGTPAVGPQ